MSLNYDNPDLKKIMPWTGTGKGPQAFIDTFARVSQFWQILAFSPEELFGAGENVAVFGRFTYKSKTQGKSRIPLLNPFPCSRWKDCLLPVYGGHLRDGSQLQIWRKFDIP